MKLSSLSYVKSIRHKKTNMFSLIYGSKKADLMEVENTIVVGQSLGSVWGKEDEEWMVNKVQGCSLQQVPTNGL